LNYIEYHERPHHINETLKVGKYYVASNNLKELDSYVVFKILKDKYNKRRRKKGLSEDDEFRFTVKIIYTTIDISEYNHHFDDEDIINTSLKPNAQCVELSEDEAVAFAI